jgi:Arc/MetJ-type ribon-helix-helix transcriptional regulator
MSTQMTVRMADESMEHVDRLVAEGAFASRAQYLNWLVRKDAMLRRSLADLARVVDAAGDGNDPYGELAGVADVAAGVSFDDLD